MNYIKSIKLFSFNPAIFLFVLISFLTHLLSAQDYVLLDEGFEAEELPAWKIVNGKVNTKNSFKGNKCIEIHSIGEAGRFIEIPQGVKEIVVKGWVKLLEKSVVVEKNEPQKNLNLDDTLMLAPVVVSPGASFGIEPAEYSVTIIGGQVGFLNKVPYPWARFEKEIKIPAGVSKIRVVCKNTLSNSIAFFDEVRVEKRQIGWEKSESEWAKQVREFKEKASRLVKNGDFEDGAQIWNPWWGFELSDEAHTGNLSCMIQNPDSGVWRGTGNDKPFKIPPGTTKLKVSVWIKAENVVGGQNPWETGAIVLSLCDDKGNEVPGGDAVARTVGTHDWKKYEAYYNISKRATGFRFNMHLGASTGKIWFDDLFAEPMTEEQYYEANLKLKNPGFENYLTGWPVYAGVATNEEAHTGEYSLKVAGTASAWEMRMQTITLQRGKKQITVGGWMKTVDVPQNYNLWEGARIYVQFKDENGLEIPFDGGVARVVGNTDWTYYSKTLTIPDDAFEMTIHCGRANVAGTVYFDDIVVEYPEE